MAKTVLNALPPVVILAGGMATRLGDISKVYPKAMVEVAGEPFISHQLRRLRTEGIQHVVLCVGHLAEQIIDFVGDGSPFDLKVEYSHDGKALLGTGGALRNTLHRLPEVFYLTYGDTYLDLSYREVNRAFEKGEQGAATALMTVLHNRNQWDKSNVLFREGKVLAYEKKAPTAEMEFIDYGLSLIRKGPFQKWAESKPEGPLDLSDYFAQVVREGWMLGFEVKNRFYEIGTPQSLIEASAFLKGLR